MKRLIILVIFLSTTINLFAQSNLQIVDPAKRWSYMEWQPWSPPPFVKFPFYIKFSGDTIINQSEYLKIWETNEEDSTYWYQKGFIRSDSNGDVYLRDMINNEGLAYKFDVVPGDTFSISNPFHFYNFIAEVDEVDQVFIEPANEYRKRIKIIDYEGNSWGEEEYWIEGVGSLAGIITSGFHLYSLTGGVDDALCQWQNNSLVYSNPGFNFCFNTVSTNEIKATEPATIFPNPLLTHSTISLNIPYNKNMKIEILDIHGKLIQKFQDIQTNKIILNRSQFSKGVYIISILNDNEIIARKKLLVQ
jgi:hypothetical protein